MVLLAMATVGFLYLHFNGSTGIDPPTVVYRVPLFQDTWLWVKTGVDT